MMFYLGRSTRSKHKNYIKIKFVIDEKYFGGKQSMGMG